MKITRSYDECIFNELNLGDAFYYNNVLYMKVGIRNNYQYNAVCLETGLLDQINEFSFVRIANVHIEYDKE